MWSDAVPTVSRRGFVRSAVAGSLIMPGLLSELLAAHGFLHAGLHILQRISPGCNFIISQNQRETGAHLVGCL